MAKCRPLSSWDQLAQITNEFRVMHARVNGETHAQAARPEGKHYSQKLQRQALERWGCEAFDEYKKIHTSALRASMHEIREQGTKASRNTRWGQQLAIVHEYLTLMHEQAPCLPLFGKPVRDATILIVPGLHGS